MWWIDIGTPEQIERQFLNPFLFLLVHPLGVVISHFQTIPFVHRGKQKAPTLRVMRWEGRRQRPHCLGKNKWGTLNVMIIQRIGFLGKIYGPETHGFWPSKYDGLSGEKMFPSSNCSHPNKGSPHNIWVLYTSLWTWYIMVYHPTFDCILLSYIYIYTVYTDTGWWLSPTPLKNDEVRQLGWLFHSQLFMENHSIHSWKPVTTKQYIISIPTIDFIDFIDIYGD